MEAWTSWDVLNPQAFEADGVIAQYIDQRLRHRGKKGAFTHAAQAEALQIQSSCIQRADSPHVGAEREFDSFWSSFALAFTDEKAQMQGREVCGSRPLSLLMAILRLGA